MTQWLSNDYYRFIFENSSDAILLTTPDGSFYRVNPATSRMFQMTEEEICECGHDGLVDAADLRLLSMKKERAEKGTARSELVYIRKDNSKFTGECVSTLFRDDYGKEWMAMIIRDMTESKNTLDELEEEKEKAVTLASIDYLTHLQNRRVFIERLREELARAHREKRPLSLLLLDVDNFKHINDVYGHLLGDLALKRLARCLKENVRPYDVLGRFGGDEFIIYMPNTTIEGAVGTAKRIQEGLKKERMKQRGEIIEITASFGIASYDINSKEGSDALIGKADKALYEAKETKNCITVFR